MEASDTNIWILWMIAIPLGPLLGWCFQKFWAGLDKFFRHIMLALFTLSTTVALCTTFTPCSLRGFWPQAANLAFAYISATCLVCLAFKKSTRSFSLFAARGFAILGGLLIYSSLFIAYWRSNSPETQTTLGDHLVLRRSSGGWAGVDWEGVTIVQQPARLPFLEKRLYTTRIGLAGDCDETSVRVDPDPISHEIRVQCGRQSSEVVAFCVGRGHRCRCRTCRNQLVESGLSSQKMN
jgi:hypothetical protein